MPMILASLVPDCGLRRCMQSLRWSGISDEKLLPPTSGFRILGCDNMSLADVLSRVEVPDMNNGTGIDNVD